MNEGINLSVVVCTYNRQKFIGECLHCLSLQTLPASKWEVIIIDNNSSDNTAVIIHQFLKNNLQINGRYVFENKQGLSYARNRGIAEAIGKIMVYIDDDVETVPAYLQIINQFFQQNTHAVGLGGRTLPKYSECPKPAWISPYLNGITGTIDLGLKPRKFTKSMKYPSGCNMVYTKAILMQAGGFNNELKWRADDKYIFNEIKKISREVYYVPAAFSLHNIDAARLTKQSFKKLYSKGGSEERIRNTQRGQLFVVTKCLELLLKMAVGFGLWCLYILKRKALQGRYIFLAQWFTFTGFLKKNT